MAHPSAPRIRPWLCALIAAAVVVGLALTTAFAWVTYKVTPEILEDIHFAQTAPVPPLPPAEPVAAAAQAALNEAGGASWAGELRMGGRLVQASDGRFSADGGSCSSQTRHVNYSKGSPTNPSLFVIDGDRAATRVDDAEMTITEEEFNVEWSEGEWEGSFPRQTSHTPTMLDIFNSDSACTLLTDVSRSVIQFREQEDVSHLPAAGEDVTRYVGGVSVWAMNEVAFHHTYQMAAEGIGHAPSNRTMFIARPSFAAVAQKVHSVTLDVDASGAPVALWVVMGDPGTTKPTIISMHYSDLGPQEISFPEGVEPPPFMVE